MVAQAGNPEAIALGQKLLQEGAVGAIILAGGMGTRLGFPHPKGMFPLFPNLTLFEIFAKKSQGHPLAIMTSPENDAETRAFFAEHKRFGLAESDLFFFTQGTLPMEDEAGHPLAVRAPDGNGSLFTHFVQSGLHALWTERGIRVLNVIPVDNPLSDPFDPNLIGHHVQKGADVTVKCIERLNPDEKVGVIIESDGKIRVKEYSEITDEERNDLKRYPWANISLFCLSMPFVANLATQDFPLHKALKPLTAAPNSPLAWKKERFIFDLLPFATAPTLLAYPRATTFAPLKNKEGPDSPESVRAIYRTYQHRCCEGQP